MVLVCHVISKDHVIKGDVIFRQELIKIGYHPVKLVVIGTLGVEI